MAFFRRWFSGERERVPTTDSDLEAGLSTSPISSSSAASTSTSQQAATGAGGNAIELRGPVSRRSQEEEDEDGMVIVTRPEQPSSSATEDVSSVNPSGVGGSAVGTETQQQGQEGGVAGGTSDVGMSPERAMIARCLLFLRRASQLMILLTVLQVMSTLSTEHIHFLSLFSLFVPWTGFEGAKEMNPAYIRVFYWGCFIMIPANFFHYLSFDQFAGELLATGLEENLKRELIFNHALFNVVTFLIMVLMSTSIAVVRKLNALVMIARINGETDSFIMGARAIAQATRHQHTGPLSSEEIAAIPAFKLGPEDLTVAGGGDKEVCVICQDEYQANDLAKRLNCRHMFHATCIDTWLERSSACPICNGDVRSIV